ncbi:MAG: DUF1134 domain-containing protein [Alphaproteobacteria bacterium]
MAGLLEAFSHFTPGRALRRGILVLAAALAMAACSSTTEEREGYDARYEGEGEQTYGRHEIVDAVADFFGITTEAAANVVERVFADLGRPNAYVIGEEASGAVVVGLRYGKGTLQFKNGYRRTVYWQGPSVGFDVGGNASKVFTLVYNLRDPERMYQRFPGVEGSIYFVAGIGVNYQQADDIVLAPIRTGVGLRAAANVGYLAYTRDRNILPF